MSAAASVQSPSAAVNTTIHQPEIAVAIFGGAAKTEDVKVQESSGVKLIETQFRLLPPISAVHRDFRQRQQLQQEQHDQTNITGTIDVRLKFAETPESSSSGHQNTSVINLAEASKDERRPKSRDRFKSKGL
jgi:hypothetical protein